MAADALQAEDHLLTLPSQGRLKKDMISHILTEQTHPTKLQYALSQRIYYEHLSGVNLFLSQNHPQAQWEGSIKKKKKKKNRKLLKNPLLQYRTRVKTPKPRTIKRLNAKQQHRIQKKKSARQQKAVMFGLIFRKKLRLSNPRHKHSKMVFLKVKTPVPIVAHALP